MRTKIQAINCDNKRGFNIYLDCSGQREYLMWHRHNGILFGLLKDGIELSELKRRKCYKICSERGLDIYKKGSSNLDGNIRHIVSVAEDYLSDREEWPA